MRIYGSLGCTRLRRPGGTWQRLRARLALSRAYPRLSALRTAALASDEAAARLAYVQTLREAFGYEIEFTPFEAAPDEEAHPPPRQLRELFSSAENRAATAIVPLIPPELRNWIDLHGHYFFSLEGNSQAALAIFAAVVAAGFFADGYRRRQRVIAARRRIPLSIGGWGTRGKSGTERLKAGMLHGLGYEVFSKTTGCEAMFIHSIPGGLPVEVYAFRPYGKATIWEQRDLLELAADLEVEVFLWECMALNPHYVEILQRHWMRDDYATITNAYPDHEDIQGPAGINVADVISNFTPDEGVMITSEINFLPVMRDAAKRRKTQMIPIPEAAGDLIGDDLLELFPYQEHPRNIALVARLGEELGIDPQLAILNMADHVVPDLGVLKRYPPAVVRGRQLEFINGCSANERTGFLNNWRRTGCADLDANTDPGTLVITVVNNRDDRISRSEVFSRILVNDSACDKHVLIGTNLRGLLGYLDNALAEFVAAQVIVSPEEVGELDNPRKRLEALLTRQRLPRSEPAAWLERLRIYGGGAGMPLRDEHLETLSMLARKQLENESASTMLGEVIEGLRRDTKLNEALDEAFEARSADWTERKECLEAPTRAELLDHSLHQLARQVVGARLRLALEAVAANSIEAFHTRLREAYSALFMDLLEVVPDPLIKGDGIVDVCGRVCPPGTQVIIMGAQNIKGTGLDFAYRWLAQDAVCRDLQALESPLPKARAEALARLEGFSDHGIADLGELVAYLEHHPGPTPAEDADRKRVLSKKREYQAQKRAPWLRGSGTTLAPSETNDGETGDGPVASDRLSRLFRWVEGWFDFLDGARRFHESQRLMKELSKGRVSHPRAAVEMRAIYARFKGGWLYEWWKQRGESTT